MIQQKDIELQPTSRDIWEQKYQLKDSKGEPIDKNISDTLTRVAMALAQQERPEDVDYFYSKFLWALENGAIPAGRIISNAGAEEHKPKTSTINCTVSQTIDDSMDSILEGVHKAGITLKAGCGIGYDFSHLRPKGSFVNGAGATTSGPLSFMDIYDKMCFTVSSAGGRRGAQMGTLHVRHPDIFEFIRAKREDGRLRQFNLSILIDEDFMRAVQGDDVWDLCFPIKVDDPTLPEIYVKWPKPEKEEYKVKLDQGELVGCKIFKTIKAKKLWDTIMKSTYDYAEPGFLLIDEANRVNSNWFCEDFSATNPCVTGDSWISTDQGLRQVKDLVGKEFKAVVNGKNYDCISKGFFSNGVKDVYRLTTKSGYSVKCTKDHKIMTTEGWKKAGDLNSEDKITLNEGTYTNLIPDEGLNENIDFKEGYALGMLLGDGTFSKGRATISIWGNKEGEFIDYSDMQNSINLIENYLKSLPSREDFKGFTEIKARGEKRITCKSFTRVAEKYGIVPGNKKITSGLVNSNFYKNIGILKGLFDADGTVNTHEKSRSVRLCQSNYSMVENVQLMLSKFGIVSKIYKRREEALRSLPDGKGNSKKYETKENFELVISKSNIQIYKDFIGFESLSKSNKLAQILNDYKKNPHKEKFTDNFLSLESCGEEEVFDCTIKEIHRYSCNGIIISNCGEQFLPPNGSCLLGSINLTKFITNPFKTNVEFDWDKFIECVKIFTRMLDNVVEISGLPLKEQRQEIQRKRRHGMGFLGLGSALAMLNMRYGGTESVAFTSKVSYALAFHGFSEGVKLAEEKGPAPIFNETFKDSKGRVVTGKEMFVQSNYALLRENKGLRDAILKHGCRFTHHSSIAPTGTISLSLGNNVSNGIEPTFSHQYSRNVIKEGRSSKEKVNVFSYEFLAYKQYVDENATVEDLPDWFVTTDDIAPEDHIKIQAAAQKYIDSSISKTINVPTDIPYEEFQDIYLKAYENRLKGCTTFRFNPEAFQGVLVKEEDLANTTYEFCLEDGEVVKVKGNELIMYDGEEHTAANLYDAIKEGYYGKL